MHTAITLLGGIGVFLLGMVIMTEGLKAMAGARLSRFLINATASPLRGALTGSISTAVLQSSSATTVAAVGFVSAGLLTFTQALGIIFGANLGTTITGWLVALLGFKLQLGNILLPLIFVGIMLRLFAPRRLSQLGYAMAGFGLIFVGIGLLQQTASDIRIINPDTLPLDSISGRLQLIALGIMATIVTQSSSAGVAMTLVAIHAGLIGFGQAAALIIGMDVGTTVKAVIATIGGSLNTRRTGFSHVIYNFLTAFGAFFLISPFILLWESASGTPIESDAEIALVAFHSSFNLIGIMLVVPFAQQFAQLVEYLVPSHQDNEQVTLDSKLLGEPHIALLTVEKIILDQLFSLLQTISLILEQRSSEVRTDMDKIQRTLNQAHDFIDQIHMQQSNDPETLRLTALIHTLDHMQRLHERCDEDMDRALTASQHPAMVGMQNVLDESLGRIMLAIRDRNWQLARQLADDSHQQIDQLEHPQRGKIYNAVACGEMTIPESTDCAEALRWLSRVSRHIARICHYLQQINIPQHQPGT